VWLQRRKELRHRCVEAGFDGGVAIKCHGGCLYEILLLFRLILSASVQRIISTSNELAGRDKSMTYLFMSARIVFGDENVREVCPRLARVALNGNCQTASCQLPKWVL
jgi:hypothetical protein